MTFSQADLRIARNVVRQMRGRVGELVAASDWRDLEQVARIALWHASEEFDETVGVPWTAWIVQRVRQRVFDELRRLRGRTGARLQQPVGVPVVSAHPDDMAEQRDEVAHVRRAISRLPVRWRFVLDRRLAGWSHERIAQVLGIKIGMSWWLACDAKKRLAAILAESEPAPEPRRLLVVAPAGEIWPLAQVEREAIEQALRVTMDVREAARRLGVGRATIYRKLALWGRTLSDYIHGQSDTESNRPRSDRRAV